VICRQLFSFLLVNEGIDDQPWQEGRKKPLPLDRGLNYAFKDILPRPFHEAVVAAMLAGVLAWNDFLTVAGQRRTLLLEYRLRLWACSSGSTGTRMVIG